MFLYNLTLHQADVITCAIVGNFSGQSKQQEVVFGRGKILELMKVDTVHGRLQSVVKYEVFSIIRSLISFRLVGSQKDYIVVGSDSGKIVVLEYIPEKMIFHKLHEETFGKSGCRRIVPGQFLASDPKGRALMIGAIEKQKFVYVMNRDVKAKLTISSPLEAHKSKTLIYSLVGMDVGFENPLFASIELDYSEVEDDPSKETLDNLQKVLTLYELDLGLNHVVRKWSDAIDRKSNMLIPVPGGTDGPGGVIVCSENMLTWRNQGFDAVKVTIPRRKDPLEDKNRGLLIITYASHKTKSMFFLFLMSEEGDLYKVTLNYEKDMVKEIKIKYFDTVPRATALFVLRGGFLSVSSEFGNHPLYQIQSLGEDDDEQEFSSLDFEEGEFVYFTPRPLKNLTLVEEMDSLCPIMDCKIADLNNESVAQFYTVCGRGDQSSLRCLRHGLEVNEMAVSELPGIPNAVWTAKLRQQDPYDAYIIVSFVNATLVLSIGETVEEVTDCGLLGTSPTLHIGGLGEDGLLQVCPEVIRHVQADKRFNEWKPLGKKRITRASSNRRQVIISLDDGELVYFELDNLGQLNEYQERRLMPAEVNCIAISAIPENRMRSPFVAVGCVDNCVRMISLEPHDCLQPMGMQVVPSLPESLSIVEMLNPAEDAIHKTLFLNIGLKSGVLMRNVIDSITGALSDTRTRFLGPRPIRLTEIVIQGTPATLALSIKPWVHYNYHSRNYLVPLSYITLEFAANFCSEQCPEGIVAVSGNNLRIIAAEKLGTVFHQKVLPLKQTPRKLAVHPLYHTLITIESEQCQYSELELKARNTQSAENMDIDQIHMKDPSIIERKHRAPSSHWSSKLEIFSPKQELKSLFSLSLGENEVALSMTVCQFHDKPGEWYLVVGSAKDLILASRKCSTGFLSVYCFTSNGTSLELVHKTNVDEPPFALCPFQGRILVGLVQTLRIYDLGKRKLLRKCENRTFPNCIITLNTQGDRIIVGDIQESVHYVKYKIHDNQLVIFADETLPRWLTCITMLDYDTVAAADKFGNFFVCRLSPELSTEVDDDQSGGRLLTDQGYSNGAPYKLSEISEYHVGEMITSLNKAILVSGANDVLIYTTLMGGIGAFIPFVSREDVAFFQLLEMHMRNEAPSLCGRDHLSYRSYYNPVKCAIDGDLCEQYILLSSLKKRVIAQELDRTPSEILKKLEDMRYHAAF